jgi:hypothetical protein
MVIISMNLKLLWEAIVIKTTNKRITRKKNKIYNLDTDSKQRITMTVKS